jgi:hypothetical protein
MNPIQKLLLYFVLPILALLLFPPETYENALPVVGLVVLVVAFLGFLLWRGRSLALTLSIFLLGLNLVIRLMLLFPNAGNITEGLNILFILTSLISIILSGYLLLRLDQPDVRVQMVA